jgi:AcrR family transcriptional regulator
MKTRGRPIEIPEDALLDAARALLLRRGLGATTAEIAARAGVSEGLVYYRYKTKEALLAAVLEREQRAPPRLGELVEAAGRGALPESIEEVGRVVMRSLRATAPFVDLAHSSPRIRRMLAGAAGEPERVIGSVERYFAAEMAAGRLRAMDPGVIARALFGAVLDRVLSGRMSRRQADPGADGAFLQALAALLLRGALPEGRPRPAVRDPKP